MSRSRVAAAAALLVAVTAAPARAHVPFQITTEARISGDRLVARTTMGVMIAGQVCREGPAALRIPDAEQLAADRAAFEACARDLYRVTAGGQPLPPREARVGLTPENDLEMVVAYPRPTRTPLAFAVASRRPSLARMGIALTVAGERSFLGEALLRAGDTPLEMPITPDGEAPGTPPLPSFRQYLALGVRHILTGYDHLLFLAGLLVVCRRFRTVAAVVTCFTLAHSVTLALAALGVANIPARIVEPLIAATIVFVGLENLFRGDEPRGRWALTFGFGLVHGLGFARALRDIGLGSYGTSVVGPLLGFNLGVELGQLAVAALLLTLLGWLRRVPAFARYGTRAISVAVAAIGLGWLIQRLFGLG